VALRAADAPVFERFEGLVYAPNDHRFITMKTLPCWRVVSDVMHGVFPLPPGYFMELQLQALLEDECEIKDI